MAIEKLALKNIEKVVSPEGVSVPATTDLDPTTTVAYEDSVQAAEHLEEVEAELEKTAEEIVTDSPEAPEVKEKNIYTKLTLDESLDEFDFASIDGSKDDEDRYVDFDMFDFIYSLFSSETDSLVRPLKALSNIKSGRGRKKSDDTASSFMYQGSDSYDAETGEGVKGVSQISTDMDGNVVLYQDKASDFDKVIELCQEYGLQYEGPVEKKAPWVRWNYSFKVIVPTYADGYPMDVDDYFEQRGIAIEDVMPPEYIKGKSKDVKKMEKEVKDFVIDNDKEFVDKKFAQYVRKAATTEGDLETFVKEMFDELDSLKVKYNREKLAKKFYDEFNDDFEDEE